MKLLTFRTRNGLRLGVKTDAGVLDVAAAGAALGVGDAPVTMQAVVAGDEAARSALATLLDRAGGAVGGAGWLLPESSLDLAPCVPQPGKILCVGLNYRLHAEEASMQLPETPVLFSKFANALAGHGDAVAMPPDVSQMDYEAEFTLVIGRRCRGVGPAEALRYVFGYCNGNDLSARDLQFRSSQWLLGKSPDGFCPVGPYVVTADEVGDPGALRVRCTVNGEVRQDGSTADMIFSVAELVSYISRYITLEPGDLILTGTPAGVAMGRADQPWLRPGDRVTVAIDGLGELSNTVAAAARAPIR